MGKLRELNHYQRRLLEIARSSLLGTSGINTENTERAIAALFSLKSQLERNPTFRFPEHKIASDKSLTEIAISALRDPVTIEGIDIAIQASMARKIREEGNFSFTIRGNFLSES